MSLTHKITSTMKQLGSRLEGIGSKRTHLWIMALTFVGYVVIGLVWKKSHWTILNRELRPTRLTLVIFNQHMDIVTIRKAVKDGNQK